MNPFQQFAHKLLTLIAGRTGREYSGLVEQKPEMRRLKHGTKTVHLRAVMSTQEKCMGKRVGLLFRYLSK